MLTWIGAWSAAKIWPPIDARIADLAWYAVAVLMLCPAIAVLGAQKPAARVWTWFIVLPFCLVFGWPAAAAVEQVLHAGQFSLETPMAVGFAFVVVMGIGNYLGTRYTLPAFLTAGSLLLLLAPALSARISWLPTTEHCRLFATLSITAAIWWAARLGSERYPVRLPLDRVWIEFRDQFGIVWSKRILDRLNEMAEKKNLPLRMGITGVVSVCEKSSTEEHNPPAQQDLLELEKSLRWLLRRFVEETWIDRQLASVQDE